MTLYEHLSARISGVVDVYLGDLWPRIRFLLMTGLLQDKLETGAAAEH
ncbi:hypothetical protein FBZ94_110193 [Bradyrhizobium sacchari]|uniref:Uncharacterized protein n=1 Tax=Bradyrhizobium sacchari TaxID=1399419 RepID=A0A560HXI7_9BRAD|nr:hypothetical protein FBZ94_110193 [Bradyrhizobium sacchari]TWB69596.1 hypothetical protein FBZ95_109193 [Bradyrhizobium sacchari]